MPITITPTQPGAFLTPGGGIQAQTDFIGPLPAGTTWDVHLLAASPSEQEIWTTTIVSQQHVVQTTLLTSRGDIAATSGFYVPAQAEQTRLEVNLRTPSGVIDTGIITAPWDATRGLGIQSQEQRSTSTSGGLTPDQAVQLQETHESTALNQLVDALTLQNLTPAGPSNGPINSFLPEPIFGVIVRIANVPPDLVADTPDGDYWFPTLAVVRIFRGSDLWMRVPIHTSSKIVPLLNEGVVAAVSTAIANISILNLSLQVTFRAGVTGTVFLMNFP